MSNLVTPVEDEELTVGTSIPGNKMFL